MREYIIRGGAPLHGEIPLQGAKNSVLPILAASLLCDRDSVQLDNCPVLEDVHLSVHILQSLGCEVTRIGQEIRVYTKNFKNIALPKALCGGMRSSILYLGPLLAKCGSAQMYAPGGCLLGRRPVDIHLSALSQMGARFDVEKERITASAPDGLAGCDIVFPYPSVGATENIIMAASLARGITTITGAAAEPEIGDLVDFINAMGGRVRQNGKTITVYGVEALHGCRKTVIPDRIAGFTYLAAALATDGRVTLSGCRFPHMRSTLEMLSSAGGVITVNEDKITAYRRGAFLLSVPEIETGPYPAFPTDAGAIALTLLSLARGCGVLHETVFSDRFGVAEQLRALGADIQIEGQKATVRGVGALNGCRVQATDLRAGAALIVAALAAKGETVVAGGEHIIRGYENITENLQALGADIEERRS